MLSYVITVSFKFTNLFFMMIILHSLNVEQKVSIEFHAIIY
nr:MAG TPA: hypothetical protein [Bacteriophage sp.]